MSTEYDPRNVPEGPAEPAPLDLTTQIISEPEPSSASTAEASQPSFSAAIHETPLDGAGLRPQTTRMAHVLFMDIVGFAKRSIDQQTTCIEKFQEIVSATQEFRRAQAKKQLISRSTGDGVALVFFNGHMAPVQCALEVSRALRECPDIGVRMGVHSGPVVLRKDVARQRDVTGEGINTAQRVMDCGDAGHILLSKTVADYLRPFESWTQRLHDLGEVAVKHKQRVHLFNLYSEEVGNPKLPQKLRSTRNRKALYVGAATLALVALVVAAAFYFGGTSQAINSVAILPFINENADPDAEHISDGLSEDIINNLGKLSFLKVINRNSAFRFKKPEQQADLSRVARELNVRAVLTGHFRQQGDKIFLRVELIDLNDSSHIWGDRYEKPRSEMISMPSLIAKEVSKSLRLRLNSEEQNQVSKQYTDSFEAGELNYRGRQLLYRRRSEDELNKSIEYFKQAIEKDHDYALAYAGLADAYSLLTYYGNRKPPETLEEAKKNAIRALEIDGTLAEAHTSLARIKATYDWDWQGAEEEYKLAIKYKPNYATAHHWYGEFLASQGRFDEAIAEMQRALEHDPYSTVISTDLGGEAFFYAARYEESVKQLLKTIEQDPASWYAHYMLGCVYVKTGKLQEAVAELEKAIGPDRAKANPAAISLLGHAYGAMGRRDEARKIIDELQALSAKKYVAPYYLATVYAALDEKEQAILQLRKAYDDRFLGMVWLKVSPRFDSLRQEPEFMKLVKRMRFAQ